MNPQAALEAAGMTRAAAARKREIVDRLRHAMTGRTSADSHTWFVPGRIEVLGKHTDYAGGRSLVGAVERGICLTATPRDDDRIVVMDIARQASVTVVLDADLTVPASGWTNYVATVARRVARNFPRIRRGADIFLASDLPSASGMSSSSALITALFLAVADVNRLQEVPEAARVFESCEGLAAYVSTVENGRSFATLAGDLGVGTTGGSEDHTAILCSRAGMLSQYAFCPTRLERRIAWDPELVFVIGVSGVSASKTGAARDRYNAAARAIERMLELWRGATGRADTVLADALASAPDAADRVRELIRADRSDGLLDRFEQFLDESEHLVPAAAEQLAERNCAAFGDLVARSQWLAERHLGNQIPETTALAASARECGALAGSAFGAGFGGSVWALVAAADASGFIARWSERYRRRFPEAAARAVFFATPPGPPAMRIE
jgi:galactokinase